MIYLVTGYMRSGTSMMMACLEAGGLVTVRHEARDRWADGFSTGNYHPNAGGLFEVRPQLLQQPGFARAQDGRALKVVAPSLACLAVHAYRAVWMERDPEEIRQSFEAAFAHVIPLAEIERCIAEGQACLANRRDVEWTALRYADIVADPLPHFERLAAAGWPIDAARAAAVVDPSRYRFRHERLTIGI